MLALDKPMAPISAIVDFYIIHRLEIETVRRLLARGIDPPVWRSANVPGSDEFRAKSVAKYSPADKKSPAFLASNWCKRSSPVITCCGVYAVVPYVYIKGVKKFL
jgi:hypothetical protein